MKKLLLLLLCMVLIPCFAIAAEQLDGQVIAGGEIIIAAPFGGIADVIHLRQGAVVQAGDPVVTMAATRVVAPEDGFIRGIFAAPGDAATSTVLYLAPMNRYTVSASISKAYKSAETRFVTIGEKVWLRCTRDGSHKAVGVITAVKDASYTVETTGGELYMEETVNIYRTGDYDAKQLIGTGTVSRTAATAITGSGNVYRLHVQPDEMVERGQLLFETFDALPGADVVDGVIRSDVTGVVSQVKVSAGQTLARGDALITVCPRESFQIRMEVPQEMLSSIHEGDACQIYFNWNDGRHDPCNGVISEVSYIASESQGESTTPAYHAYVTFQADDSVRLGMTVTVVLPGKEETP